MWAATEYCLVAFSRTCGGSVALVFAFPVLH